jgi:hypothetical protein
MRAGSFHSAAPSYARSGGQFARNGSFAGRSNFAGRTFAGANNFAGRYGNSFGRGYGGYGNRYGNYFGRGYGGYGGYGGWSWGGYWPWYGGLGLGLGWGYPYDYGYYYPDAGEYYYSYPTSNYYSAPSDSGGYYAPSDYGDYYSPSDYGGTGPVAEPAMAAPQQPPTAALMAPMTAKADGVKTAPGDDQQAAGDALQYYSEARAAFLEGDYSGALRLAGHAAVDAPRNAKVHELISLTLFALHDYGPAASEAHAAMALGAIANWSDLAGYYYDAAKHTSQLGALEVEKYTAQLRALEKASADNPKSAAEHFLLGYHYLMIGARENGKSQFADAVKLVSGDKLADHYLQELQANSPLAPPAMASKPQGTAL